MKHKDKLFTLIKTMSRGEKRAFKLFAKKYNKKNLYIELFSIIDRKDDYNPHYIRSKFVDVNGVEKQFSVIKNQLFHQILTCLRGQVGEKPITFKLNEYFENANILMNRGMFVESLSFLEKAEKLCYESEDFHFLQRVLNLKNRLHTRILGAEEMLKASKGIYEEKNRIKVMIDFENQLENCYHKIYYEYRVNGVAYDDARMELFQNLKSEEHQLHEDAVHSIRSHHFHYLFNTIYFYCVGRMDEAYLIVRKHLELFESNPRFLEENTSEYFKALNNVITLSLNQDKDDEVLQMIAKLDVLSNNPRFVNRYILQRIFEIKYSNLLSLYINNKDLDKGMSLVGDIRNGIAEYKNLGLSIDRHMRMSFGVSLLYFWKGDWNQSLDWLAKINPTGSSGPTIILCYSRILDIINHFELGHYSLVESKIRSTNRYLKQVGWLNPLEIILFRYLKKLIGVQRNDMNRILEAFEMEVEKYLSIHPDDKLNETIDLIQWLNNKVGQLT